MYEVVVIGSGPAGLAATMYCIRKGMDVQLITGHMGGKSSLSVTFPDVQEYRVLKAREQVQSFIDRVEYLSHTWRNDRVAAIRPVAHDGAGHAEGVHLDEGAGTFAEPAGFEVELVRGGAIGAERLIVATGVHATPLGVPGEKELLGRALGSSAISYTHLLRDRSVVIIGDSDRAIEAALEASVQAKQVHLVLESQALYSHRHLNLALDSENIAVHRGCRVLRFTGDEFARSVTITSDTGAAAAVTSGEQTLEADAFFVERNPRPRSELVADLVNLTLNGSITINERNETSHPAIFAAGDVTTVGVEQILIALGEGARAGLSAYRHMTMQV